MPAIALPSTRPAPLPRRRPQPITVEITLDVASLPAVRRALWSTGEHQAAVRVLQAYAEARAAADHLEEDLR